MDEQLYEIREGVRRSKAAWLCGHETIQALVNDAGTVLLLPLKNLLSPKPIIETRGPRGADWGLIYRMTQRGQYLPPITVAPGTRGIPLADVGVEEDELELFRQRYSGDP